MSDAPTEEQCWLVSGPGLPYLAFKPLKVPVILFNLFSFN